MKVLLSIKPEFAFKIFNGTKKYEYRRTIFKKCEVTIVLVYATYPIQKVIGEFEIGEILHEDPKVIWANTKNDAGITEERFMEYFTNMSRGYAIRVKSTKMYDAPFPLKKFTEYAPPQSFLYLN